MHVKFHIPLGVAEAVLLACLRLNVYQLHNILARHLRGGKLGNIAFNVTG